MVKHRKLTVLIGTLSLLLGIFAWMQAGRDTGPADRSDPQPLRRVQRASPMALESRSGAVSRVVEAGEVIGPASTAAALTAEEAQAKVLEEIHEAAISYDPSELPTIEKHLQHGDPLVREAARDGIITLGAAEGAPLLRRAAALAGDPRESVALLDAADYLELPSGDVQKLLRRKKADK